MNVKNSPRSLSCVSRTPIPSTKITVIDEVFYGRDYLEISPLKRQSRRNVKHKVVSRCFTLKPKLGCLFILKMAKKFNVSTILETVKTVMRWATYNVTTFQVFYSCLDFMWTSSLFRKHFTNWFVCIQYFAVCTISTSQILNNRN